MTPWQRYLSMSWANEGDTCEFDCGRTMGPDVYVEGQLGHYCSEDCRRKAEGGSGDGDYREDFHADG